MRAVGIILAGGNNNRMKELTHKRAVAAMPIAGSYRSIDFALSNMTLFQEIHILVNGIGRSAIPVSIIICNGRCKYVQSTLLSSEIPPF